MRDPDSNEKAQFLLELYRKGLNLPEKELYEYFLNHAVETTKSTIGFFHLVSDDQESIILTSWNREALKNCTADYNTHYPVAQAGNWADSIRLKRPIIYNDFSKSPNQKGLPEGHVVIKRMLSFPIMEDGKAKAIFGVGNKTEPYVKNDIIQLELVANELNKILKQRKIESELWKAKNYWERTFDAVPDLIAILDEHRIVQVNRAMARQLGVTPDQAVGLPCYRYVHNMNFPPEFCPQIKTLGDGKEHTAEVHEPLLGGDFLVTTTPIKDENGKIVGSVHVARNITERKKAEEVCRKSEQQIADILGSIDDYVYSLDKNWNVIYISNKAANDLRFKAKELIGKNFWQTFPAFVGTAVETNFRESMAKRAIRRFEWKTVFVEGCAEFAVFPSVEGITVYGKDIAERKKAEEELRRQQSELVDTLKVSQSRQSEISALLEASKAVLIHRDFNKSARAIFDSCKNLLGATAGYVALLSKDAQKNEVLFLDSGGLPCTVDPSLPMPIRGLRAEAYSSGKAVYCNDFSNSEWVKLMPKGHVELKNVLFAPLIIDNKTVGIIGLANKPSPFTKRDAQMASAFGEIASVALMNSQMLEKLEKNEDLLRLNAEHLEELVEERTKQLKDSERLAAIGATAGMVGHDIRNPLQAIASDVFLLRSDLSVFPEGEEKEGMKESLDGIEKNVEYINKIIQDLQDFAKTLKPAVQETHLNELYEECTLKMEIPDNIEVSCEVTEDAEILETDPVMLKRILSNLVSNAVQAMPQGGKICLRAYRDADDTVITVHDTGMGIPEEVRPRLFTPLFTTKSKGQGFGLAVVKRMTEALGGTVTFESQNNEGTTFIVRLPTSKK
jgi:PAS domain S-box-containing protein